MSTNEAPPHPEAPDAQRPRRRMAAVLSRPGWKTALREFVVIVAGVLAALGAQAWWQGREEAARERDYLQRMADELARDSTELQDVLLPGTAAKLKALAAVAPYVSGRDASVPDTLALLHHLSMAGRFGISAVGLSRVTFRDIESTGSLRLIHDPALRAKIVSHYSAVERETEFAASRRSGYAMYFARLLPGELFREQFTLELLRPYDLGRVLERVRSEEVRDMLTQEVNYALFLRRQQQGQADRVNALLADIRTALKRRA